MSSSSTPSSTSRAAALGFVAGAASAVLLARIAKVVHQHAFIHSLIGPSISRPPFGIILL